MKRFIEVLALVFCLLFTGLVVAQQQPAVRIFQQTASDDSAWQKYMSIHDKADIESGFLPIHKLAEHAYSTASNRNFLEFVPEDLRPAAVYQAIFIIFNNLGNRDKISFDELRERAKTTGIYLPDMRMFLKETREGFEDFKNTVAKSIKKENNVETIPASILGVLSYLKINNTSYLSLVSQNFREQAGSISAFTSYNELPANVILEDFKKLGQGDGLWVPVELEYIKAFAKAFMERTAMALRQETLLKNTSETKEGIEALRAEVASMKKDKIKNEVNEFSSLKRSFGVSFAKLNEQIAELTKKISNFSIEQTELFSNKVDVTNRLVLLDGRLSDSELKINRIHDIESSIIANTDSKIGDVYSDINKMAEVVAYNEKVIVLSLSAAILAIFLIGFFVRRHDKRNIKQGFASVDQKIDVLEVRTSTAIFDRHLVSKESIAQLEIGKEIVLPISVGHESYEVKVIRNAKDFVIVDGIRHHINDKKSCHEYGIGTNIPTMIDRAANHGNLTQLVILENVKVA